MWYGRWSCESFGLSDELGQRVSYMRSDGSVECGGDEHAALVSVSWVLMALWPIGVPSLYLVLLVWARDDIKQRQPSFIAASTRFLWVSSPAVCAPPAHRLGTATFSFFFFQNASGRRPPCLLDVTCVPALAWSTIRLSTNPTSFIGSFSTCSASSGSALSSW